ncbi:MAG: ATP-binding protein [Firmicutes bacterium]|nr:ATP-binding protein [Bacillota bacterium]
MNNYLSFTIENKAVIDLTKVEKLRNIFIKESSQQIIVRLIDYYSSTGTGELGFYKAFRWDESKETLAGILTPDSIKFDELVGYERQKKRLIKNTEAFLSGRKANNVLLFGDSGTGKSSSIKALLNEYAYRGLRLIEITREQGKYLPQILELLKNRGLYFIIFMDDLSFEDFETDYKYLKAVMEGGIEVKPANVLFYATSNRRHIVKEKWADRQEDGEIHISDAVQEKLSLAERFGMTISYQAPDKKEFLDIVKNLAVKQNISMGDDEIEEKALQWEKRYNGFSGRTAQQFINYLDSMN